MTTKTYLLVPNFDYPPDSSICLGALLADPLSPHRVLASLARDQWPEVITSVQKDRVITRGSAHGASLSTSAQVLQIIGAKVGGEVAKNESTEYSMESLRTEFFKADPGEDGIRDLLKNTRVQNAMQATFWSRPLFLITGVKIAEGFSLSSKSTVRRSGTLGADVPIPAVPQVSVGAEAALSKENSRGDSFKAGNEVVLAYRLPKISRKGWKERRLAFEDYRSKSAFLRGEADNGEWDDEIELASATAVEISEADEEEPIALGETPVNDEGSEAVSYAFTEP